MSPTREVLALLPRRSGSARISSGAATDARGRGVALLTESAEQSGSHGMVLHQQHAERPSEITRGITTSESSRQREKGASAWPLRKGLV